MNRLPDVEPVLRAYLADTGDRAPDRVLDDVAARIARQPRRTWRLRGRPFMNTYAKLAAAVAAVLIVGVVGWRLLPGNGGFGGQPTPAPTPTAAPTAPPLPDGGIHAGDYVMRTTPGDSMAFVITAPEGWQGFGGFFLGGPNAAGAPDGVGISVNHDPEVVSEPCDSSAHTPAPGASPPSVDDLVAAISARSDIVVSGVTDAVLAGHQGKQLDIQFPASLACPSQYIFAEPKGLFANGPANHWHVWLLDVGGETAVVVMLDYAGTTSAHRAAAEAAIASIRIIR
jgi:hypothetical protein